jgi:hypothetical protein
MALKHRADRTLRHNVNKKYFKQEISSYFAPETRNHALARGRLRRCRSFGYAACSCAGCHKNTVQEDNMLLESCSRSELTAA